MKKMVLAAALLAVTSGSTFAADMVTKAKPMAPAAFDPWDFAFGSALMSDYIFRGITQSNHKPSVAAYFEPRYNLNKDLQLYVGVGGESISFPNRAAAEIDVYGGIRPTFGAFAFDFGGFGYIYPGGTCFNTAAFPGSGIPGSGSDCSTNGTLLNGNVAKRDFSFFEVLGKVNWTVNDQFSIGANEFYSPNFLNTGAWGNYASITAKYTMPSSTFGSSGIGAFVSGEFGRQWLGTSDSFYGSINYADYNTWNIGVGFTYKVFTLDLRYSDTNLSRANCNAFTSDFTARFDNSFSSINTSGVGSGWCDARGIVKFSADLTAMTNLK